MLTVPTSGLVAILNALIATGGYLDAVTIRLFSNNFSPTPPALITDFTQADFTDYAPIGPLIWGDPWVDSAGNVIVTAQLCQWVVLTPTVGNTIYGYYATIGTGPGTAWHFAELFEQPKIMTEKGQAITFAPQFSQPVGVGAFVEP